jgi:transcriptional regulator GlxA family with amidase domain
VEANYVNKNPQQVAVQRVIDEMHLHLAENWQVRDMAAFTGCSEQHLRKMFIQHTGQSPKAYYQSLKLDIASALLKKGQHNITQLAYELGFSDAFHFSKAFKKKYHLSPSDVVPQVTDYTKNLLSHD